MNDFDNREELLRLIKKYNAGNSTPDERHFLELYYGYYEKEGNVLDTFPEDDKRRLQSEMHSDIIEQTVIKNNAEIKPLWANMKAAVAIAALFILVGYTVFFAFLQERKTIATIDLNKAKIEDVKNIRLPDGSMVFLKGGSKLTYSSNDFSIGKSRNVHLAGEAYFDVHHDPARPFIVHSGNITTKVLGTAFYIRADPNESNVEVTVTRGKVQVFGKRKSLGIVTRNQQIAYNSKTGSLKQLTLEAEKVIEWKPKEYSFENVTMLQAATFIEEEFNKKVVFMNSAVKNCTVTATFYANDSLEEILLVLCGVTNSTYNIEGNKIVIDGKACN